MSSSKTNAGSSMGFSSQALSVSFVSPTKVVDHTEYVVQVSLSGKTWQCQRRYKEFDELHQKLRRVNPDLPIPNMPPKKWFGNMVPGFVEQRQRDLQAYVDELLQNSRWASMHILRAFFDTHRHMNDSQQDTSMGYRANQSTSSVTPMPSMAGDSNAQFEAEAMEAEDQRRDAIVERAEKLMVEIYAAPPVLDATAAAEQVEEVEDALSKRTDELAQALSAYRESLATIKDVKCEVEVEAKEEGSGQTAAAAAAAADVEDLCARAQSLVEHFRQESPP